MPEPLSSLGVGHVWLTGVSGAGKSATAPRLAARLGCTHADTDQTIVAATGRSVAQIFGEEGEPAFREIERRTVADLATGPAQVISLGGGALLSAQNQTCILASGVLVHLDAATQTLVERLLAGSEARPLLHAADRGELATRLDHLRRDRRAIYGLARLRVETDGLSPDDVAARIVAALSGATEPATTARRQA